MLRRKGYTMSETAYPRSIPKYEVRVFIEGILRRDALSDSRIGVVGYFGALPLVPPFDDDQNVRAGQNDACPPMVTVKTRRSKQDKECEAFRSPRTKGVRGQEKRSTTKYCAAYPRFA